MAKFVWKMQINLWVGRHASFPQKLVLKVSTSDEFEFETAKTVCLL